MSLASLLAAEVDLYVLCVLPELSTRLASHGVKVFRLPTFHGVFKPLRFVAALIAVPLLLLRYRIHTVQLNGFLESILILPARLLGRSAVYTRHGPFEIELYSWSRQPHKFLARRIARWSVRFTTHVVCVSQAVAESVRPMLPATRYSVIANWISGQKPFRPPVTELSSRARVLCASRLRALQRHSFVDRSCAAPTPGGRDDSRRRRRPSRPGTNCAWGTERTLRRFSA